MSDEVQKPSITVSITGQRQIGKTVIAALIKHSLLQTGFADVRIERHPQMRTTPEEVLAQAIERGLTPGSFPIVIEDLDDYQINGRIQGPVYRFNPFTGQPRNEADIASDPTGILIHESNEALKAYTPQHVSV